MDEIKIKELEGEQTDGLEGTSPSSDANVELNNSPVPTPEEIKDAGLAEDNASGDSDSDVAETENVNNSVDSAELGDGNDIGVDENPIAENVEPDVKPAVEPAEISEPVEKTFTQSQVNDLVGKTRMETREQTYRAVYGRYGVEDEAGMDALVGNAQRYETVRDEYDEARKGWEASSVARDAELTEVKEHVALLESGIDRNRFDDAKAIMKAKGLEITVDNIQNELATHPEWKGAIKADEASVNPNFHKEGEPQNIPAPESTIKVLGNESDSGAGGMSEEEFAMKHLFKL